MMYSSAIVTLLVLNSCVLVTNSVRGEDRGLVEMLQQLNWRKNASSPHQEFVRVLRRIPEAMWIVRTLDVRNDLSPAPYDHQNEDELASPTVDQCRADLKYMLKSLLIKNATWAAQMLDAAGKPDSGILQGRFTWAGNYEECIGVRAPPGPNSKGFSGHYCWLVWTTKIPKFQLLGLRNALCVPSSCQESYLRRYYDKLTDIIEKIPFLRKWNETISLESIQCRPPSVQWNTSAIVFTVFLGVLVFLVIVATVCEFYLKRSFKRNNKINEIFVASAEYSAEELKVSEEILTPSVGKVGGFLLCFSAIKNGCAILDVRPRAGQLDCLHGIRFLSMAWVILGHCYLGGFAQMNNILSLIKEVDTFAFQAVVQGTFSVDSFFLLSGFLLAYLFLKDGAKTLGVRGWIYYYVHRYLRLTPALALVLGMWATVWLYVANGPFWDFSGSADQINCQTQWWQNVLYINNFASSKTMCMAWSWYLANDMQFYVISPLFLVPLQRWPVVGVIITGTALLVSWITTGVISYQHGFNMASPSLALQELGQPDYFDEIYSKPYTRIGPYLVGILVAFVFVKIRNRREQMNKMVLAVGWASATTLVLLCVFGLYNASLDTVGTAFYYALARSTYALGVGWVMLACLTGNGGPVNWILSWKVWFPLSRMTYSAYLIHLLITTWYFTGLKDTYHFSHPTTVLTYLGILMVAYGAAFLTSLVLESPFIGLEKYFRTNKRTENVK